MIYAPKLGADGGQTAVLHRYDLTEGCKLTSELVAKAATQLKKMNAPTFEGKYVCILHPSVAFDLRQDPAWVAAHQYAAATEAVFRRDRRAARRAFRGDHRGQDLPGR
ncbi:MAG: hypothetical protein ACLR5H_07220 [Oscillospiraceae bacterium]